MDTVAKDKKSHKRGGLITKTWERCKSIGRGSNNPSSDAHRRLTKKSKSWHGTSDSDATFPEDCRRDKHKRRVTPEGCFSVYVGPHKQRFVIRMECVNHPLFGMLLEEAEKEYGYCSTGPLELPCSVDVFNRVLMEMDSDDTVRRPRRGCGFPHGGNFCFN
ncbi:hypothetical protein CRG98_002468 [Punica granatum]|uniref:Auxin-responsive protein SAUR71-like n=1 Tax=Punica granatum TaxID=22663 RepID=A0A2I0L8E6_PUNGR|nr:hypothetical protein CRG98_002468 [Punica granatum]